MKTVTAAVLLLIALALAGSDGPLFPWLNFGGCGCLFLATRLIPERKRA